MIIVLVLVALVAGGYWGLQLFNESTQEQIKFRDYLDQSYETSFTSRELVDMRRSGDTVQAGPDAPRQAKHTETGAYSLIRLTPDGEFPDYDYEQLDLTAAAGESAAARSLEAPPVEGTGPAGVRMPSRRSQ